MEKIIVFDFDKTLTLKDSFNEFIYFRLRNKRFKYIYILYVFFLKFLYKLKLLSNKKFKEIVLQTIINIKEAKNKKIFIDFSKNIILKRKIMKIFNEKKKNNIVYIISASPIEFLNIINSKNYNIGMEYVVSNNKIKITKVPFQKEKVKELQKKNIYSIDEIYTDSIDDLELMKISKKIFIVKKDRVFEYNSYKNYLQKN